MKKLLLLLLFIPVLVQAQLTCPTTTQEVIDTINIKASQSALEDTAAAIRSDIPTAGEFMTESGGAFNWGGSGTSNTNIELINSNPQILTTVSTAGYAEYTDVYQEDARFLIDQDRSAGSAGSLNLISGVTNQTYTLTSRNSSAQFREFDMSTNTPSITITDEVGAFGLEYSADYSANGLLDDRWVPDIAAVRAEISDSISGLGTGSGDMTKAVYDPTLVEGDAFDMDNMIEGSTNLILTSAERTIIGNTSGTNTGDQVSGDFDHNGLINTHNLTTDIDHNQLTNYDANRHFLQSEISIPASQISDFDTEVSNNSSVTANTAKVTNQTHTGDVFGSTTLTIANNAIDEGMLNALNAPTDEYVLSYEATGGQFEWKVDETGTYTAGVGLDLVGSEFTLGYDAGVLQIVDFGTQDMYLTTSGLDDVVYMTEDLMQLKITDGGKNYEVKLDTSGLYATSTKDYNITDNYYITKSYADDNYSPIVSASTYEDFTVKYADTDTLGLVNSGNLQSGITFSPTMYYHKGTHERLYFTIFEGEKDAEGTSRTGFFNRSHISYYDLTTKTFGPKYRFPEKFPSSTDLHNLPVLIVADDGSIIVVKENLSLYGSTSFSGHNSTAEIWRSDNPEDISSFTQVDSLYSGAASNIPGLAYPHLFKATNGDLYLLFRHKIGGNEAYLSIIKSDDDGATWEKPSDATSSQLDIFAYFQINSTSTFAYTQLASAKAEHGMCISTMPLESDAGNGRRKIYFLQSSDGYTWKNAAAFKGHADGYTHDTRTAEDGLLIESSLYNYVLDDSLTGTGSYPTYHQRGLAIAPDSTPYVLYSYEDAANNARNDFVDSLYVAYYDTSEWTIKEISQLMPHSHERGEYIYNFAIMQIIPYGDSVVDIIAVQYEGADVELLRTDQITSGTMIEGADYQYLGTTTGYYQTGVGQYDVFNSDGETINASHPVRVQKGRIVRFRTNDNFETMETKDVLFDENDGHNNNGLFQQVNSNLNYMDSGKLFLMTPTKESSNGTSLTHANFIMIEFNDVVNF
jgi:hypothetical protein